MSQSLLGMYSAAMGAAGLPAPALNTSHAYVSSCDIDCGGGTAAIQPALVSQQDMLAGLPSHCPCAQCAFASAADAGRASRKICCITQDLLFMTANASLVPLQSYVPSVFVSAESGATLAASSVAAANMTTSTAAPAVQLSSRYSPIMDPMAYALWLVAVLVLGVATCFAARHERASSRNAQPAACPTRPALPPQDRDRADEGHAFSLVSILVALALASLVLGGLFLLLRAGVPIVYIIMPIYALVAVTALASLVVQPVVRRCLPGSAQCAVRLPCQAQPAPCLPFVAHFVATLPVLAWFLSRHTPAVYFFQNVLGALIVAKMLDKVKLTSGRLLAGLLGVFFVYDIFMVFLTPLLTGGTSVMVAVATAGTPEPPANAACHCRQHPADPACGPGERMPILLALPRSAFPWGDALLGLGDLAIPGLALVAALRHDYARWGGPGKGLYWALGMAAYASALGTAFAAVALTGQGQPALLYLVPALLVTLGGRALCLREGAAVWTGPVGAGATQAAAAPDTADLALNPIRSGPAHAGTGLRHSQPPSPSEEEGAALLEGRRPPPSQTWR